MKISIALAGILLLALAGFGVSGDAPKTVPAKDVDAMVAKAMAFLQSVQNADGSFSPKLAGPGVSALVVAGLVRNGKSTKDPLVEKTLKYLEGQIQKDGGVYNKFLANYVTSVAVMAFKESNTDGKYDAVLKNARNFLVGLQLDDEKSPNNGGFGYDKPKKEGGKADASNTEFTVEALLAAGLSKDDPAVQKAIKYLGRLQNLPGETNDQPFAKKTTEDDKGGFVYKLGDTDDKRHATPEGGLRSLGAMTYGGLKTFLYAGVSKEDPRVKAAVGWMRRHYTLEENPNMGQAGIYYYYQTFGKAMDAWGEESFEDSKKFKHEWRRELFDALKKRQQADGSWRNAGDKTFGEASPELATAFALISLSYCEAKPKK